MPNRDHLFNTIDQVFNLIEYILFRVFLLATSVWGIYQLLKHKV